MPTKKQQTFHVKDDTVKFHFIKMSTLIRRTSYFNLMIQSLAQLDSVDLFYNVLFTVAKTNDALGE